MEMSKAFDMWMQSDWWMSKAFDMWMQSDWWMSKAFDMWMQSDWWIALSKLVDCSQYIYMRRKRIYCELFQRHFLFYRLNVEKQCVAVQ